MKKLLLLLLLFSPLFAAYTEIDGIWYKQRYEAKKSATEYYDDGLKLIKEKRYSEAARSLIMVVQNFPSSVFFIDALYQVGLCNFCMGHLDIADDYFSAYLNRPGTLKHFEKVFEFKFRIAECFRQGRRRHPYGVAALPRIATGKAYALELYDEIAATLPSRRIAAYALFSKGLLLKQMKDFKESIEVFQTLTRRFPKHVKSADAFVEISEVYLAEVEYDAQNLDLLAHAQINIQNFERSFPSEERIEEVKQNLQSMREGFATALYDTGRFYERKRKHKAAAIYFRDTLLRYPKTEAALSCQERLEKLDS